MPTTVGRESELLSVPEDDVSIEPPKTQRERERASAILASFRKAGTTSRFGLWGVTDQGGSGRALRAMVIDPDG